VLQAPPADGNWQPITGRLTDWTPHYPNPHAQINQVYARNTERVGLYMGYYRNQRQGAELISSLNRLVISVERWGNVGETRYALSLNDGKVQITESRLRGPVMALLVWHWYWVDGQYTGYRYWAKVLQAKSKLFGRGDDGAVVILYTELDISRDKAADRLQQFAHAMLSSITSTLQHVR
jgi:EpsI family protein